MSEAIKDIKEIQEIVQSTIVSSLSEQLAQHDEFIQQVNNSIKTGKEDLQKGVDRNTHNKKEFLSAALGSIKNILSLINKYFPDHEEAKFIPGYRLESFDTALEEWVLRYPEIQLEFQNKDRFTILDDDSLKLRFLKRIKNASYSLTTIPQKLSNSIRRLRKKKPKTIHYWRHKIPERDLYKWYNKYLLAEELLPYCEKVDRDILHQLQTVFNAEEGLHKEIISSILQIQEPNEDKSEDKEDKIEPAPLKSPNCLDQMKTDLPAVCEKVKEQYDSSRLKVGTIELSASKFRKSRIEKRGAQILNRYNLATGNWSNAHKVVIEDWKLDLELYRSIYTIKLLQIEQESILENKIESINDQLKEILTYYDQMKTGFSSKFKDRSDLKKQIIETRYENKKVFKNKKIQNLSSSIVNQNFPGLLDRLEVSVKTIIDTLPDSSEVTKEQLIDGPIEENSIYTIAPSELVFFESYGVLEKSLKKGKLNLLKKTGATRILVEGQSDTLEFSLDSAMEILNDESKNEQEAIELIKESLERATLKVNEIQNQITEIEKFYLDLSATSIWQFNSDLFSLTNNENIYEIRFRLTKAKAVATSTAISAKALNKLITAANYVWSKSRDFLVNVQNQQAKLANRYLRGIKKAPISTEVSNFLADSANKITELPFLYQRLFKSEPLNDKTLFVGRESELSQLNDAFIKWDQGNYAATILLGEKGSGLTSLINLFTEYQKWPYSITRIKPENRIYNQKQFLDLLGLLCNSPMETMEQAIEILNGHEKKRVFVLEDLQTFFIRKVGGFNCISLLQRLITSTNDNIFWIVNTTPYTWEYLHKAFHIGDYFEYQIELNEMDVEQITEIISNRNQMSGYNILFNIPENGRARKKLKNYSSEEIQEIYRDKYFSNLNRFSRSNITLSLLYWQLSVEEVTEDTINIRPFEQPDLSFISFMDKTKLFVLHAITLHDRLTPAELGEVLSIHIEESHLILLGLFEDGILKRRGEEFIINPLIYRQIINLLKSQNLLS